MPGTSERLLTLLSLLQARRDWPGQVLADRLEVSPRTVRRDVDRLREIGYAIASTKGRDGGYRLAAGAELPPLLFDDDQAVALALALQVFASDGSGAGEAATRALGTVRQVLPARLRHRVDSLQVAVVQGPEAPEVGTGLLVAVAEAVRDRAVLRFDHRAEGSGPDDPGRPPRRVEPHGLLSRDGRWYLLAWDLDRSGWRTFRADRMTLRTPRGPRFVPRQVPGGDAAAFVAARFTGSAGHHAWPCRGQVVLHAPAASVLPYVGDGTVQVLGPERCLLSAGSWSWAALAASVARFDVGFEVVGPPALRLAVQTLASRFSAAAEAPPPPGRLT